MAEVATFRCPSCGNSLEYIPGQTFMECPFCRTRLDAGAMEQAEKESTQQENGSGFREYHCANCGAGIVTTETTAAARCYFCHSPVVLTERLSSEFKPDGVIPFVLDREGAAGKFRAFLGKKRFLDRRFLNDDQMESFSGVYFPYWYANLEGDAFFDGEGTKVNVRTTARETITHTRYFHVIREGKLSFRNMQRKALRSADRKLSDGIHPYTMNELKAFSPAYLSGFLAERRDVERDEVQQEMLSEAEGYAPSLMKQGTNYNSLKGETSFHLIGCDMKYVLLPAWVLTYQGKKASEPYYYMMNGQTGTVCGKLPVNRKKLLLACVIAGLCVTGLLCVGGALFW